MNNASLTLVGSGIKFLSHLTTEAKVYIQQSAKVLYLINEPAMKEWIQMNNTNAESLDEIYTRFPLRLQCYKAITDYILETLYKNIHLCVVLYGHPTVFAKPGLDAAKIAREKKYQVKILPGISAEACLFADLFIDPGASGCQSFETTDFLVRKRNFDVSCHLVLWQVGVIGALGHVQDHDNKQGIQFLQQYLASFYNLDHNIFLYQAAQYPTFDPIIQQFPLGDLSKINIPRLSTLYIPPLFKPICDPEVLKKLGIDIGDLGKQ